MRWEITHSTDHTSGQLFQATNWVDRRMPGPPVHVHPSSEESFEVIEGTLDVFVDGQWSQVGAGERTTVPANVPHTLRNASDAPVKMRTIVEPAGRAEAFFRDMHRLIQEGKIKQLPPKRGALGDLRCHALLRLPRRDPHDQAAPLALQGARRPRQDAPLQPPAVTARMTPLHDLLARPAFAVDARVATCSDVIAAARASGHWEATEAAAAAGLSAAAAADAADLDAAVAAHVAQWRRARRLTSADDTVALLSRWGVGGRWAWPGSHRRPLACQTTRRSRGGR